MYDKVLLYMYDKVLLYMYDKQNKLTTRRLLAWNDLLLWQKDLILWIFLDPTGIFFCNTV